MTKRLYIIFLFIVASCYSLSLKAQTTYYEKDGFLYSSGEVDGELMLFVQTPNLYVFPPIVFKSNKEQFEYYRLIRNVKIVYPIAREINQAVIETYEYLQTLPDEKARNKHIKKVEKGLKEQYTARMKRLSFTQGKLLIKLVDRQSNQNSYELVKAFMGPFKAGFYQVFASLFGASLKKEYDPQGEDRLVERVILMVESGQL